MDLFGIRWVGLTVENGRKLLLSLGFIAAVVIVRYVLHALTGLFLRRESEGAMRARFWTRQGVSLLSALLIMLGLLSIWFSDPARLATALGLVSAGLAFALQKVVTSAAGYVVILRGRTFTVGDRISMGGVRGDVVGLGFIQTTIMEMGQPPAVQGADPAMWVKSRQFTGRIVTVSNSKIFDEPVFNYTREFPYIWDEITLPVSYKDDRRRAEEILITAVRRHALDPKAVTPAAMRLMQENYRVEPLDLDPKVYWRLTDNWLEMSVRFLFDPHGVRNVKDAMSREILAELDAAGIGIASGTYEIVGVPPIEVRQSISDQHDGRS